MKPAPATLPRRPGARPAACLVPVCLILAGLGALLGGCGERLATDGAAGGDTRTPLVPHPQVERDLDEILRSGVVRMVARYNSSSYFVHKGGQAGFDYELLLWFAREHDLTIEVVVPEPGEDEISLLNSGRGDVVCTGWTPAEDLARWVAWTRPTNFVRKALLLPADDLRGEDLTALNGLVVTLPHGDPFRGELQRLRRNAGAHFRVTEGRPLAGPEELLALLDRGDLQAVVTDDVVARAAMAYLENIRVATPLGDIRPTVWLVRHNSPELKAALNLYLKEHLNVAESGRRRRSQVYGIIYDRYFENPTSIRGFQEVAHRPDKSGRISIYDGLIRNQAEALDLDWRLVAALVYQESRFYPYARSKAGAQGLMQVLPAFAGAQTDSLYVPEANLRAGLRLMKATWTSYAYLDSLERTRFTLAEYHAGPGHLADARRLAMDLGRDPNRWEGSLAETLPLLEEPRWFSRMRHGYYRGTRTVDYVEEILARYRAYMRLVPRDGVFATDPPEPALPGAEAELLRALPELAVEQPPAE